jgi:hypothetical protein
MGHQVTFLSGDHFGARCSFFPFPAAPLREILVKIRPNVDKKVAPGGGQDQPRPY